MDVRLILDPPASGSVNMSIDEALLESAGCGETVLRFYSWSPATLSLGYFQGYEDRRRHAPSCELDVVRRATGGGAIVHDHDLTYSFVAPISHRFSHDHQQLVQAFHETLCESLANWKIVANLHKFATSEPERDGVAGNTSFLCFRRRASEDVVLEGAKIAGSAQKRRKNALLQHGSVLLGTSVHAPELAGIADFIQHPPRMDDLIQAWCDRIAVRLGVRLVPGEIHNNERESAECCRQTRYEDVAWQRRR